MPVEIHREMAYEGIEPIGLNMDDSGHILVAEDSAVDAFFLQRAFNRAGLAVTLHVVRFKESWAESRRVPQKKAA